MWNIDGSVCLSVHPCSCDPVCALHMCACFCVCTWVFIPSVHMGGTTVSQAHAHACMHAHTHKLAEAGKSHPDTNLSLKPRMTFWRRMTLSVIALSRSTSSSMSWWSWRAEPSEQSPHQPLQSQGRGCPKWAPFPLLRELVPNGFHTCYGAMGQPPSSTDKVLSRLVPRGLGGTHAAGGAQHAHTLTPSQWPSLP